MAEDRAKIEDGRLKCLVSAVETGQPDAHVGVWFAVAKSPWGLAGPEVIRTALRGIAARCPGEAVRVADAPHRQLCRALRHFKAGSGLAKARTPEFEGGCSGRRRRRSCRAHDRVVWAARAALGAFIVTVTPIAAFDLAVDVLTTLAIA